MKYRDDFVTNSSSSSFILAFTDKKNIAEELAKNWPQDYPLELGQVFSDVLEAEPLSKQDVIEIVQDNCEWSIAYHLEDKYQDEHDCSFREARNYIESPEGQDLLKKEINKVTNKVCSKLKDKTYFVEVEYSDHENYSLEQVIMPKANATVYTMSHH